MPKPKIEIVNIVVSTQLGKEVPLERMAALLTNTEYNPEQFPGLVLQIKEPKSTALIFGSGKIVCTGPRTMDKVREAVKKIIKTVEKVGVKIKAFPEVNIQNIVAAGSIGMRLNLDQLAVSLENIEYEPEQFPGLVYKMPEMNATFLLFSNGKIVCTGTKSKEEVDQVVQKLIARLKKALHAKP